MGKNMKKIMYMMRHGQTLFNVQKKIQGACDSPLTKVGIKQAKETAKYLKDITFDYAYCSTSERASDTLELVLENRMPYTRVKGLKERDFGKFEGEREDLHLEHHFDTIYGEYGGETTAEVKKRIKDTCTDIMEREGHNQVLLVSHGGACMCFLSQWEDPKKVIDGRIPNCCIFKYEYENKKFKLLEIIKPEFDF